LVQELRKSWEIAVNSALAGAGIDARVSSESYAARGDVRVPQPKIGPLGAAVRSGVRKSGLGSKSKHSGRAEDRKESLSSEYFADGVEDDLVGLSDEYAAEQADADLADLERLKGHRAWGRKQAQRIYDGHGSSVIEALISDGRHVFTRCDLAKKLFSMTGGWLSAPAFDSLLATVELHPSLRRLSGKMADEAVYTTDEILRRELAVLELANELIDQPIPAIRVEIGAAVGLSPAQKDLCRRVLAGGQLQTISGVAGGGKTTLLKALNASWQAAGLQVYGAAIAAKAARKMQSESGIACSTIASLLLRLESGKLRLDRRSVIVIDEASMVSVGDFGRILKLVKQSGARVVFLGDPNQIAPVKGVSPFQEIHKMNVSGVTIDVTQRHLDPTDRLATEAFFRGDFEGGFDIHAEAGNFVSRFSLADAAKGVLADWLEKRPKGRAVMIATTRKHVAGLNIWAREALRAQGVIGAQDLGTITVYDRHDEEQSPAQVKLDIAMGEEIVFLKNDKSLGVSNGTTGVVRGLVRSGGTVLLQVQIEGQDGRAWLINVDMSVYKDLAYGYAMTAHKAQGQTVDYVSGLAGPSMDGTLLYSIMSRHRCDVKMYWSAQEFGREGATLDEAFAAFRARVTRPSDSRMASAFLREHAGQSGQTDDQRFAEMRRKAAERQRGTSGRKAAFVSDWAAWAEDRQKARNAEKDAEFQRRAAAEGWSPAFAEKVLRQRAERRAADETTRQAAQMARMKAAEAKAAAEAAARRTKPGSGFSPS
jgi:hypothetical protein